NISLASQPFDSAAQRFSRRRAVQSVSVEVLQRFGLQVRDDGLVQNFPGGRQILFQQHRRQREHIADVVKAITRIIRGKIVRRSRRTAASSELTRKSRSPFFFSPWQPRQYLPSNGLTWV